MRCTLCEHELAPTDKAFAFIGEMEVVRQGALYTIGQQRPMETVDGDPRLTLCEACKAGLETKMDWHVRLLKRWWHMALFDLDIPPLRLTVEDVVGHAADFEGHEILEERFPGANVQYDPARDRFIVNPERPAEQIHVDFHATNTTL